MKAFHERRKASEPPFVSIDAHPCSAEAVMKAFHRGGVVVDAGDVIDERVRVADDEDTVGDESRQETDDVVVDRALVRHETLSRRSALLREWPPRTTTSS
jgi:hypothetical protein